MVSVDRRLCKKERINTALQSRAGSASPGPERHTIHSHVNRPDCQSEPELKTGFWEGRVFCRISGHRFKNLSESSLFPDMKGNSGPKKCLFIAFWMGDRKLIRTRDRPENQRRVFGGPQKGAPVSPALPGSQPTGQPDHIISIQRKIIVRIIKFIGFCPGLKTQYLLIKR